MILDDILQKRREQLAREMSEASLDDMIMLAAKADFSKRSFKNALNADGLSVIAEVKKASPSKNVIEPNFKPQKIAEAYEKAGANAISCLTEEHYFQGSADIFKAVRENTNLPMIRKDFIFDKYQVYHAKAMGADAVLLIAAVLDDDAFFELYELSHSLDMDVLAEAHDENEVKRLINIGCDIIGINNRNLKTFEVALDTTKKLSGLIPKSTIIVSESGIKTNFDMRFVNECGADAVLIGETLMRSRISGICECMKTLREGV